MTRDEAFDAFKTLVTATVPDIDARTAIVLAGIEYGKLCALDAIDRVLMETEATDQ